MRSDKLARRRQELIARSEALRHTMVLHGRVLAQSTAVIDRTLALLRRIGKHPVWIAGLVAGITAIRPTRLSVLLRGGVVALRTWRLVRPVVQGLRARH